MNAKPALLDLRAQREIRRRLKRTVARQLYRLLERTATDPASS
jgi:hypothetical protein